LLATIVNLVATDGESTGDVIVMGRYTGHARRRSRTTHRRTNGNGIGKGAVGRIEACLDEILALGLRD
jgi:hypothetical protein